MRAARASWYAALLVVASVLAALPALLVSQMFSPVSDPSTPSVGVHVFRALVVPPGLFWHAVGVWPGNYALPFVWPGASSEAFATRTGSALAWEHFLLALPFWSFLLFAIYEITRRLAHRVHAFRAAA